MPREVCLYGPIDAYSVETFIQNLNNVVNAGGEDKIKVRINTGGGEPDYAWGAVAKIRENIDQVEIQVDGKAHSAGFFALCYCDKASAVDTAQFLIHRAAYPEWVESSEDYFTPEMRENLNNINSKLKKAVEGKIDVAKLEALGRGTLKEIFSMDDRKSIILNAKEAKRVGLISEIIQITPSIKAEITSRERKIGERFERVAAEYLEDGQRNINFNKPKAEENEEEIIETQIPEAMTAKELKEKFPAVYAEISEEGRKAGIKAEQIRANAWSKFIEIDADAVKKGIASGEEITMADMADFSLKAMSPERLKAIEKQNPPDVQTQEEDKTGKTALKAFEAEMKASLQEIGVLAKEVKGNVTLVQN